MSGPGGSRGALAVTSSYGSITHLIGLLKEGDRAAAQPLWDVYFTRIVALARAKLRGAARRSADEEDVALSAFDSFCRRAEQGQFPRLDDRGDLWQLLFVLTVRKAVDLVRYEGRAVRGGGRLLNLADLSGVDVDGALGPEASPALAAQMADELERLAARLTDESLRNVMFWKMDGWTNREIAWRLGCTEKTVERKLRSIRRIWGEEGVDERGGR
jgi:DNA-directed RNA polymerase specialized sigma24 family protein